MTQHIRNFCIIAHIDHGKSTLADRVLALCDAVSQREQRDQMLDKMELERERGITIKAQAVRLAYRALDGQTYQLNLIDTPGHVDFTYEVSRSLAACEGALLLVDATQGVEAQTLANVYLAVDQDLEVVSAVNKCDLAHADVERCRREISETVGLDGSLALPCSGKTGVGVREVLEAVIAQVPPPRGSAEAPLKALLFDSWFDPFRGVVVLCRVIDGRLRRGERIRLMRTQASFEVQELGCFRPAAVGLDSLEVGEVGFVIAGIKDIQQAKVGDTLTHVERPAAEPCPGFKQAVAMVFAGIFPIDSVDYGALKDALAKLQLNDASFAFEPETSQALGFGFRCGFLGLLHLEIVQERLEREYNLKLVTTAPTVVYEVHQRDGTRLRVDNPARLPPAQQIEHIDEPMLTADIHVPKEFVGAVMRLCEAKRGSQKDVRYLSDRRVVLVYQLPMGEVVYDFFDRLKSVSRGFASCDFTPEGSQPADLIKLDVLINGEACDALSVIVHRQRAYERGESLCRKLKDIIPRQQFEVAIQAAIGGRVISRTTVKAFRKNVTAKCYGGDISRKRKLLEKQKEGKRRMKSVGAVELPQEAFLAVLRTDD